MTHQTDNQALYNTDAVLWENYGKSCSESSPTGAVSVTISKDGSVGNGMHLLARFASQKDAAGLLKSVGFKITRQLGCGHVKTNLNARYTR